MDNVKLVKIYSSYGKADNEVCDNSFLFNDTLENRIKLLDQEVGNTYGRELFETGKENAVYISNEGGDWDDPTGTTIIIKTIEEEQRDIEIEHRKQLKDLENTIERGVVGYYA